MWNQGLYFSILVGPFQLRLVNDSVTAWKEVADYRQRGSRGLWAGCSIRRELLLEQNSTLTSAPLTAVSPEVKLKGRAVHTKALPKSSNSLCEIAVQGSWKWRNNPSCCMCAVVKTDGSVPVYEDYKVAINLSSDTDECLLHSVRCRRSGATKLSTCLPGGGTGKSLCLPSVIKRITPG